MAYSFLIFDFGGNEDVAQQARHRIEGWRQGFRLDKKLQLRFERKELEAKPAASSGASSSAEGSSKAKGSSKGKPKSGGESSPESSPDNGTSEVLMIVRLDFSDHEKLSLHRWLERIPGEEPFKTANPKTVRAGDPDFQKTSELFDLLE